MWKSATYPPLERAEKVQSSAQSTISRCYYITCLVSWKPPQPGVAFIWPDSEIFHFKIHFFVLFILVTECTLIRYYSVQFSSVTQSCPTLWDPMNRSMPGLPVHHQLPEFTQTHVHRVGDAIQLSHPLSSPSPPAPNPSQHQSLFQWVNSLHEVAKVLEFQL